MFVRKPQGLGTVLPGGHTHTVLSSRHSLTHHRIMTPLFRVRSAFFFDILNVGWHDALVHTAGHHCLWRKRAGKGWSGSIRLQHNTGFFLPHGAVNLMKKSLFFPAGNITVTHHSYAEFGTLGVTLLGA